MDTELIRFRIDAQLARQAERVCADAGFELRDVLRLLVTRIARDGVAPAELYAVKESEAHKRPFHDYDDRLWADLKPSIDAEVALALLTRFIADCTTQIDEAENAQTVDRRRVDQLAKARAEARSLKLTLNVADAAAVQTVLQRFGPRLRSAAA